MNRPGGFTLLELIMTIAIAAVLTTIGVPALSTFTKNSSLKADAYELVDALSIARSEAIKRGAKVVVCRSANPTASSPTCGGTENTWSSGWLVYAVEDSDDDYDAGTDILIARGQGSAGVVAIKSNDDAATYLEYKSDGSLDGSGAGRYAVCDDRGENYGKQITIPLMGRPYLESGTASTPISDCDSPG